MEEKLIYQSISKVHKVGGKEAKTRFVEVMLTISDWLVTSGYGELTIAAKDRVLSPKIRINNVVEAKQILE